MAKPPDTIAARILALIRRAYDGSVNAAAQDLGMPQSTLAKIVSGEIRNPRAITLKGIAQFFDADLNWLITGKGEVPRLLRATAPFGIPEAQVLRWTRLVNRLAPTDGLMAETLMQLPTAVYRASVALEFPEIATDKAALFSAEWERKWVRRSQRENAALQEAWGNEYRAWIARVESWIEMHGIENLRALLERNFPLVQAGFRTRPEVGAASRRTSSGPTDRRAIKRKKR